MENFVLMHMPVCCIYMCHMFITRRIHRRFYGLNLKKEMVIKPAIDTLDSSMMNKIVADSKAKGKKPGSTHGLLG